MSYQSGNAASLADLFTQFVAFVTQAGAGNPGWSQIATQAFQGAPPYALTGNDIAQQEVYLMAPGLSGTEKIYINLRSFQSLPDDRYNIELRAAGAYLPSNRFDSQPLVSPPVYLYVWNQAMPYWFIANGQRAIVIVKVQNTYQCFYIGKLLPYGTPGQYPYPVFVGSMGINESQRFSDADRQLSAFFDTNGSYLSNIDGTWLTIQNWQNNTNEYTQGINNVWPWNFAGGRLVSMANDLDGGYTIFPGRIENSSPSPNVVGEFDGVGFVTGYQNSSESTIEFGGNTWLVIPNGFRSGLGDYAAFLLT
jgi:hypothetical protein